MVGHRSVIVYIGDRVKGLEEAWGALVSPPVGKQQLNWLRCSKVRSSHTKCHRAVSHNSCGQ